MPPCIKECSYEMKCKNCPYYPENRGGLVLRNVISCPCTWCHTPEDSNRQTHHSDSLTYNLLKLCSGCQWAVDITCSNKCEAPAQRRMLWTIPLCGMLRLFMDIFLRWCEIGDPFLAGVRYFTLRSARLSIWPTGHPLLVMYICHPSLLREMCLLMQRHGWSVRSTVTFECHF
jgi:hypothetical protein